MSTPSCGGEMPSSRRSFFLSDPVRPVIESPRSNNSGWKTRGFVDATGRKRATTRCCQSSLKSKPSLLQGSICPASTRASLPIPLHSLAHHASCSTWRSHANLSGFASPRQDSTGPLSRRLRARQYLRGPPMAR